MLQGEFQRKQPSENYLKEWPANASPFNWAIKHLATLFKFTQ
jgi:hypothetical protein